MVLDFSVENRKTVKLGQEIPFFILSIRIFLYKYVWHLSNLYVILVHDVKFWYSVVDIQCIKVAESILSYQKMKLTVIFQVLTAMVSKTERVPPWKHVSCLTVRNFARAMRAWYFRKAQSVNDQTPWIHKTAVLSASSKYCSKTYCQTCRQMLEFNEGSPNKQRACNILLNQGGCCERYMTRALSMYHS